MDLDPSISSPPLVVLHDPYTFDGPEMKTVGEVQAADTIDPNKLLDPQPEAATETWPLKGEPLRGSERGT